MRLKVALDVTEEEKDLLQLKAAEEGKWMMEYLRDVLRDHVNALSSE